VLLRAFDKKTTIIILILMQYYLLWANLIRLMYISFDASSSDHGSPPYLPLRGQASATCIWTRRWVLKRVTRDGLWPAREGPRSRVTERATHWKWCMTLGHGKNTPQDRFIAAAAYRPFEPIDDRVNKRNHYISPSWRWTRRVAKIAHEVTLKWSVT
jgi:hypothetical protein